MKALKRVLVAVLLTAVVAALAATGLVVLYGYNKTPLPFQDHCEVRVADQTVSIDLDQAHYASIIAGVATQRRLVPRATTIALATAYQESGLHNLDYGDRDSLGLFQQRPSQGWGTASEVMDPWYAANAFYAALVKVPGWQDGDVNDVAQAVQRSGHPNGYARHVENARRVASALTGETPASLTCLARRPNAADPGALAGFLGKTLPADARVITSAAGLTVTAPDNRAAWSAAHIVVANAGEFGVRRVVVGRASWEASGPLMPAWRGDVAVGRTVEVSFG